MARVHPVAPDSWGSSSHIPPGCQGVFFVEPGGDGRVGVTLILPGEKEM